MKKSVALAKWHKGILAWFEGKTMYLSVPFTWLVKDAEELARRWSGEVYAGGPGISLLKPAWAKQTDLGEVVYRHNPDATFTSKGCPFSCEFCAVPKIEGEFREFYAWRPAPIICDNNLLAASRKHFEGVIDSVSGFNFVDFNQGLDARLLKPWHIDGFKRLRSMMARFSFDDPEDEGPVKDAVDRLVSAGFKKGKIRIYCLIGWKENPEEAIAKLETVRSWGLLPNPMRYQPLDAARKNAYVAPGWTERKLRDVMRYYAKTVWYGRMPFSEYCHKRIGSKQREDAPLFEEVV